VRVDDDAREELVTGHQTSDVTVVHVRYHTTPRA
jgi:hypothetical protein